MRGAFELCACFVEPFKAHEQIAAHGGTVSHQHGVGRDHAAHLAQEKGALGMDALAALCRQFDLSGIMNPGKLLQDGGPWAD